MQDTLDNEDFFACFKVDHITLRSLLCGKCPHGFVDLRHSQADTRVSAQQIHSDADGIDHSATCSGIVGRNHRTNLTQILLGLPSEP
jgi:hypothetical protein